MKKMIMSKIKKGSRKQREIFLKQALKQKKHHRVFKINQKLRGISSSKNFKVNIDCYIRD